MFSLESPYRGDSNEHTKYTNFYIYIYKSASAAMGYFLGTQERVRNSRGKRAISVRSTEVLLYFKTRNGMQANGIELNGIEYKI